MPLSRWLFLSALRFSFECSASVSPLPLNVGIGWNIECSSQRGAVVVAPEGATLIEAIEEQRFLRCIESAKGWFQHAKDNENRVFNSLILVTGVIKCKSWTVAAILNSSHTQSGKVSFSLTASGGGSLSASHSCHEYHSPMWHSGPTPPSQKENQCLFIRGYRIMQQSLISRFAKRVKVTNLQKSKAEYHKLGNSADSRRSLPSGSSQYPLTARNASAGGDMTDFDCADTSSNSSAMDTETGYVVENLSNPDEVFFRPQQMSASAYVSFTALPPI
jgi:hypothetical protein